MKTESGLDKQIEEILNRNYGELSDYGVDNSLIVKEISQAVQEYKEELVEKLKKLKQPVSQFDKDLASDFNRHEGVVKVITNATIDNIIAIVKEVL